MDNKFNLVHTHSKRDFIEFSGAESDRFRTLSLIIIDHHKPALNFAIVQRQRYNFHIFIFGFRAGSYVACLCGNPHKARTNVLKTGLKNFINFAPRYDVISLKLSQMIAL